MKTREQTPHPWTTKRREETLDDYSPVNGGAKLQAAQNSQRCLLPSRLVLPFATNSLSSTTKARRRRTSVKYLIDRSITLLHHTPRSKPLAPNDGTRRYIEATRRRHPR